MKSTAVLCAIDLAGMAAGRDAGAQEADNGTDPTKLRRSAWASCEHMDLDNGVKRATLRAGANYALFLEEGRIFVPAINHSQSIGDDNQIRETVPHFYYVPKLPDPAQNMTNDPAAVKSWEGDRLYGSLAVTAGTPVGKAGDRLAQVYVKSGILPAMNGPRIGPRRSDTTSSAFEPLTF
ncbi:hypothetical protein [Paracoccus cavernae]